MLKAEDEVIPAAAYIEPSTALRVYQVVYVSVSFTIHRHDKNNEPLRDHFERAYKQCVQPMLDAPVWLSYL